MRSVGRQTGMRLSLGRIPLYASEVLEQVQGWPRDCPKAGVFCVLGESTECNGYSQPVAIFAGVCPCPRTG